MFTNLGLVSACCYLPTRSFRNFILSKKKLSKKAREKSRKRSDIVQFGRWRDSFSSALCSIFSWSTLFQPMTARVISKLYYKFPKGTRLTSHVCTFEIKCPQPTSSVRARAIHDTFYKRNKKLWEALGNFLRTLEKCEKDSPSARAFPHLSSVLKNSQLLI